MQNNLAHITQADSLRADILGSPTVWLPRRDEILDWLTALLTRLNLPGYILGETEADDLVALDKFLRKKKVAIV